MTNVFIDGSAGTTGLRIKERLAARSDVKLIEINEADRKNDNIRSECINSADAVFLCLPDDAARQAVSFATNKNVIIIDSSTAHRTEVGWAYGFPELSKERREAIRASKRIAVPGCHASGFCSLVYPLINGGIISPEFRLSAFSLTGYSGGGKKMIAEYNSPERSELLESPALYALSQNHKHLPEMQKVCGLNCTPLFVPVVADFYSGMAVTVQISSEMLNKKLNASEIRDFYNDWYAGEALIKTAPFYEKGTDDGFAYAGKFKGRDDMEITVCGNEERMTLISRFCNLGKGASGAAVQCFNIATGCEETKGLVIGNGI